MATRIRWHATCELEDMFLATLLTALLLTPTTPTTQPAGALLTDFTDPASNARWRIINDDVMGGRSTSDVTFADGVMTFAGTINTNGGGFASIRMDLPPGRLAGVTHVTLRLRTSDPSRPYALRVEDTHQPRLNHHAVLPLADTTDWQTVTLPLTTLRPRFRGEYVNGDPVRPDAAVRLGIMLNDAVDGPFRTATQHGAR